jgi:endo-1,3-1,4-beta-glycanase ExoK
MNTRSGRRAARLSMQKHIRTLSFLTMGFWSQQALAIRSAELFTAESYGYGRVEARVRFAPGDGVVSSLFLWKDKSEQVGTFWNELDFEKLGADCHLETNPIYGNPASNHSQRHALALDLCGSFHTYAYEWTPEAIVWRVDGTEVRRETGAVPQAFAKNAGGGMQIHFNLWPGDATFGGNFVPSILPVHEYVDWVQFSAFEAGEFRPSWREDFEGASLPAGWQVGNWPSPKNRSTHAPENVNFVSGYAVLSLTADDALGPTGAQPEAAGGTSNTGGTSAGGSGGPTTAGGPAAGSPPHVAGTGDPGGRASESGCSLGPRDGERSMAAAFAALALAFLHHRWAARRGRAGRSASDPTR